MAGVHKSFMKADEFSSSTVSLTASLAKAIKKLTENSHESLSSQVLFLESVSGPARQMIKETESALYSSGAAVKTLLKSACHSKSAFEDDVFENIVSLKIFYLIYDVGPLAGSSSRPPERVFHHYISSCNS